MLSNVNKNEIEIIKSKHEDIVGGQCVIICSEECQLENMFLAYGKSSYDYFTQYKKETCVALYKDGVNYCHFSFYKERNRDFIYYDDFINGDYYVRRIEKLRVAHVEEQYIDLKIICMKEESEMKIENLKINCNDF